MASDQSSPGTYQNPKELFEEVANRAYRRENIVTGVEDDQFVLRRPYGESTLVGWQEDGDTYVVGAMWNKTETVGRHAPREKIRQNECLKCVLYRMNVSDPSDSEDTVDQIVSDIKNGRYDEKIDTGYLNGYRVSALDDVLDDVFKWY